MTDIEIASVMICGLPRQVDGRRILSGYHGVWEAVADIPHEIKAYLTDDVGNEGVSYGGLLQIADKKVLGLLDGLGLFACFRGVPEKYLKHMQVCPPKDLYLSLMKDLKLVGWDISTGNGWCTASCEGLFPINPFTGEILDKNSSFLNEYGLFGTLENCLYYCQINDEKIPQDSPWYPVAVYVDSASEKRLSELS